MNALNPVISIPFSFDFVSSGGGDVPVNPVAQTGDLAVIFIAVIVAVFALALAACFFLKKYVFAAPIGTHASQKASKFKTPIARRIFIVLASVFAAILLSIGITLASQNKSAIAESNDGGYLPESIQAVIDDATGDITIENAILKNVGDSELRIDQSYINLNPQVQGMAGLINCDFTITTNEGTLYSGHPDGSLFRPDNKAFHYAVGASTTVSFKLTGIDPATAKQLAGKRVFDVMLNEDSTIPSSEEPNPDPSKLAQAYNGTPLHLLETSDYYTISGDNVATVVGTYTVYAHPAINGVWSDGTNQPKEFT